MYLIDFGLARTAGEQGLTTAGSTLGTLAYMAPERFEGGEVDARSDIYALTCVLYECLTGSRPYPADSLEQQIAGHMVSPLPRPSDIDPRLAAFDEVIAKGMAKKPDKRYQTAGELAAAARRALNAPVRRGGSGSRHAARPKRTYAERKSLVGGRRRGCWSSRLAVAGLCDVGAVARRWRRRRCRRAAATGPSRRSRRRCPPTSATRAGWSSG